MAKRRTANMRVRGEDLWNALSDDERRLFYTLIIVIQALGDERYYERAVPAPLRKTLRRLDPHTVYSVIAECLSLLIDTPVWECGELGRRAREGKKRPSAPKKRLSAAKKRPSAATKKRRAKKKPAPKRRKRKGPAK